MLWRGSPCISASERFAMADAPLPIVGNIPTPDWRKDNLDDVTFQSRATSRCRRGPTIVFAENPVLEIETSYGAPVRPAIRKRNPHNVGQRFTFSAPRCAPLRAQRNHRWESVQGDPRTPRVSEF